MSSTVRQIACEQQDGKPCGFDVADHVDSLWTTPLRCGQPPLTARELPANCPRTLGAYNSSSSADQARDTP